MVTVQSCDEPIWNTEYSLRTLVFLKYVKGENRPGYRQGWSPDKSSIILHILLLPHPSRGRSFFIFGRL